MASQFRYTEIFSSLQGEARHAGTPSIFIRLFGCNFRCPKFNLPETAPYKNEKVQEVINQLDQYNSIDDLPIIDTGCDSYVSIYPEFKRFAKTATVDEMAALIISHLPSLKWNHEHLVITGGEPLLPGWQKLYIELFEHKLLKKLKHITFETNGTQKLTHDLLDYLKDCDKKITFSVSTKLTSSGEKFSDAVVTEAINSYIKCAKHFYLKFVVDEHTNLDEIYTILECYSDAFPRHFDYYWLKENTYVMPVGGTQELYHNNARYVAEVAMKHGFKYSPRLHCDLWGNNWGT
jgi:6-pyruvoyltetrahydropterin 2'-reductase